MEQTFTTVRHLIDFMARARSGENYLINPESERSITFLDLQLKSRVIESKLHQLGLGRGDKVAFALDNGFSAAQILLGAMYGGFICVPLNVRGGMKHMKYMLEHCDATAIVVERQYWQSIGELLFQMQRMVTAIPIDILDSLPCAETIPPKRSVKGPRPSDNALLIYTSGSTGLPRGAVHSHRTALAAAKNCVDAHALSSADRSLLVLPLCHINAQLATLVPALMSGGSVVVPTSFRINDFWRVLLEYNCTWSAIVPTIVSQLLNWKDSPESHQGDYRQQIRFLRTSSAPLSPELHRQFIETFKVPLIQAMGCTEGGIVFSNPLRPGASKLGSAGLPTGFDVKLVDPRGVTTATGEPGEIVIRGPAMMRGYYKDPVQTAGAFTQDGWFRSGDIAFRDKDGYVFVVGRSKELLIKGGVNIAPREIDEVLESHPAVLEAATVGVPDYHLGEDIVTAVVVRHGVLIQEHELLSFCESHVGLFKAPTRIVFMSDLPKGPSGKVQRLRLLEIVTAACATDSDVSSSSDATLKSLATSSGSSDEALSIDDVIKRVWAEVLAIEQIDPNSNFFALGGHSLAAIHTLAVLRDRLSVTLSLSEFFENATITAQAALIRLKLPKDADKDMILARKRSPQSAPLASSSVRPNRDGMKAHPLSPAQRRIWFLECSNPGVPFFNECEAVRLTGELNAEALQKALNAIVERHESLRSILQTSTNGPLMIVKERWKLPLKEINLPSAAVDQGYLEAVVAEETKTPFRMGVEPGIRATVIHTGGHQHVLLLMVHHIICDRWSLGILWREVAQFYKAACTGEQVALSTCPIQHGDYAMWQLEKASTGMISKELEYWEQTLRGATDLLTLPSDRPRPSVSSFRGARMRFRLSTDLTAALREYTRIEETSLFIMFTAALNALFYRYVGVEDIVIGVVVADRDTRELESIIGPLFQTHALRTQLTGDTTFRELVSQVQKRLLELYDHRAVPFDDVVRKVQPVRNAGNSPLFQVAVNWRDRDQQLAFVGLHGLAAESLVAENGTSKFDLSITITDAREEVWFEIEFSSALFDKNWISRMVNHYRTILLSAIEEPRCKLKRLQILPEAERRQVLYEWNETEAEYPKDKCIQELFEEQVAKTPTATAAAFEDAEMSYEELNRRANKLAHYLRKSGVKPDARVAICVERGFEMIVGLLGILKAGGAYVPLDPEHPVERLKFMLEDSAPMALLTQGHLQGRLPQLSEEVRVIDLTDEFGAECEEEEHNPDRDSVGLTPQHLAYVIYTSGSTGTPKGVMIEHQSLINTLVSTTRELQLNGADRIAFVSGQAFDISLWEVLAGLTLGGVVEIRKYSELFDTAGMMAWWQRVTVLHAVPSMMRELISALERLDISPAVRLAITGGDKVPRHLIDAMRQAFGGAALKVFYGPTETAILASSFNCDVKAEIPSQPPIGKPIANTQIYILDTQREPVPVGVCGELYIGGVGVARGYLNQPELTAERFVSDPFTKKAGARMYKTGDLGRWLTDGNIEFLGRNDFQVKIRGFRIELGEIEARLAECVGVKEAVVVAPEDPDGDKRLVAYYTLMGGERTWTAEQLRAHLGSKLPEYMVPAAYVKLESLPLTRNGKLDRKALPTPDEDAYVRRGYEAPQGRTETILAEIWAEVLKLERVGRHDNFFELGGHSLMAMRVVTRVREAIGVYLGIGDLFRWPVLAHLAQGLEGRGTTQLPFITVEKRRERLPLSLAQQRLWFLTQMKGMSEAYHVSYGVRLKGQLNRAALRKALSKIVSRHEALRTTFLLVDGQPTQQITPVADSHLSLLELDLRQDDNALSRLDRYIVQEARQGFNLEMGPLIRARLLQVDDDDHVLLITMHHIVADGWSMGILIGELNVLYAAFMQKTAHPLPELQVQYADYAIWQRRWIDGEVLQQQVEYWKKTLTGAPALLEVPTDHVRPSQQDYAGNRIGVEFDQHLTAGLMDLSKRNGTTLYMTLLTAWATLLSRLSGDQEVVIGTPVANRHRLEIEHLIGFFVNTLAVRVDLSGAPSVRILLNRVKERVLMGQEHQDLPFDQVVEIMRPVRSLAHSSLFQVMFSWQNEPKNTLALPGVEVEALSTVSPGTVKFDLKLSLQEVSGRLVGGVEYVTALFEQSTIERFLRYLWTLLHGMVANDSESVDRLQILPEAERRQVLYEWNETEAEYPKDKCIQELFEEQVAKTPTATAVAFEDAEMSYEELNRRANKLAHYLRKSGVKPDARVAICVERGFEMIVGLLGILKAGGAYVPLDPEHPVERLKFMLEDSAPMALLTQGHLQGRLPQLSEEVRVIDLTDEFGAECEEEEHNPDRDSVGLTPQHLAYVIYTSGSTGTPKGVMIEHQSLVNYIVWAHKTYYRHRAGFGSPTLHSIGFDGIVTTLFGPIIAGQAVVLLRKGAELDSIAERRFRSPFSLIKLTPSHLKILNRLIDLKENGPLSGALMIGGEQLKASDVLIWQKNFPDVRLINHFGPTETTVGCCSFEISTPARDSASIPIGKPIANTQIYILDTQREPVPVGVCGELYIGGVGVARGYLNQPELTAERFVSDPFTKKAGARMYKTGDLGRWLTDGNIEFLGRNDFQVKIRGFRIELGEIEARLAECVGVKEAVVVAPEDPDGDKRLVAYYTLMGGERTWTAEQLRAHLGSKLPEYMVPAAYVKLESLPLTRNGKLDRKALPTPDEDAYVRRGYEAPQGRTETILAEIWAEVLKLERVGRHDNFFELGGHSLMAVTLVERMRRIGFETDVSAVFVTPTVAGLAMSPREKAIEIPPNRIPPRCARITPEMVSLVRLTPEEIARIVRTVSGGARNVQDIYPLAPLQEGILFHHLMGGEGDPYLGATLLSFETRTHLDDYLHALHAVIDRHDVLRTAVVWEGLPEPVQVVWREVTVPVEEVQLDGPPGDASERLYARFDPRRHQLDLRRAPLLRVYIAYDLSQERWLLMQLLHQLVTDHMTTDIFRAEVEACLLGEQSRLRTPLPFRNLVGRVRLETSKEEHERYFRRLLEGVEHPTAPFALLDVWSGGTAIKKAQLAVDRDVARRLRDCARALGVSAASVCHLAWGLVLARLTGRREDVVFGTVLFGRMRSGEDSDRAAGLFINTLPVRIRVGDEGVKASVRGIHRQLADLMRHEYASLALAQRCSDVAAPAPLFTTMLNYRHSKNRVQSPERKSAWDGVRRIYWEERTSYPVTLSVDDVGKGLKLAAQVQEPIDPERVCDYMHRAMEATIEALEASPDAAVRTLEILPEAERRQVLYEWNETEAEYPKDKCIQELFEEQVAKTPTATAVAFEDAEMSYEELNRRANKLAHYLRKSGVKPDARVAICVERGFEMIVGLLGILKAGGAYVPLDPEHPVERLKFMLEDSAPMALLTQGHLQGRLPQLSEEVRVIDLTDEFGAECEEEEHNPDRDSVGLTPQHLAYVIYTSGSTGTPKGVMGEHGATVNRLAWMHRKFPFESNEVCCARSSYSFVDSIWELFGPLLKGICTVLLPNSLNYDIRTLVELLKACRVTRVVVVPSLLRALLDASSAGIVSLPELKLWITSGEHLRDDLASAFGRSTRGGKVLNLYGATEDAADVSCYDLSDHHVTVGSTIPIGKPIANTQIYILDTQREPVPVGVCGELYIGGVGVARGYLNQPELTAERFVSDPFTKKAGARMYKTGDLGRWLTDGNIEFLGRNDFQVKIRGFRIELGEIEARLAECVGVKEAVVVAPEDPDGDKRLVAYYTLMGGERTWTAEQLRAHLGSKLPEYMVPAAYVKLESLPLTRNGKLDRKALPTPDEDAYVERNFESPVGEVETVLARIWAEMFNIERVGRHDNFFELGGHSLLLVHMVNQIWLELGVEVSIRYVFLKPTLADLAELISVSRPESLRP